MAKTKHKDILNDFISSKVCVWQKDNNERVIGILKDYDDSHLLIFDEKTSITILVKRDDFSKIELWKGGNTDE